MANSIKEQIEQEIAILQEELSEFDSTLERLDNAKILTEEAIAKVNNTESHFDKKVQELGKTYKSFIELSDELADLIVIIRSINFPDRLDRIENEVINTVASLDETKDKTINELQKASETIQKADFDGRFTKLQSLIDKSVSTNKELHDAVRDIQLDEQFANYEQTVSDKIETALTNFEETTRREALSELNQASNAILEADIGGQFEKLHELITNAATSNSELANLIKEMKLIEKIQEFEININSSLANTLESLQVTIHQTSEDLKSSTNTTANNVANSIQNLNLPTKIEKLSKDVRTTLDESLITLKKDTNTTAYNLANSIHNLNLPTRFDKLDANVTGINAGLQNILGRFDSLERNILDKFSDTSKTQSAALSTINKNLGVLEVEAKKRHKANQRNTIITWILIILGITSTFIL